IASRLWRKWALNCAINPLTVLHNCRNGGLAHYPQELAALCQELTELLTRCGQADAALDLQNEVVRVIQATASNLSSMQQDVAAGRRSEIRYLLGHARTSALASGCPTPLLDALHLRLQ